MMIWIIRRPVTQSLENSETGEEVLIKTEQEFKVAVSGTELRFVRNDGTFGALLCSLTEDQVEQLS